MESWWVPMQNSSTWSRGIEGRAATYHRWRSPEATSGARSAGHPDSNAGREQRDSGSGSTSEPRSSTDASTGSAPTSWHDAAGSGDGSGSPQMPRTSGPGISHLERIPGTGFSTSSIPTSPPDSDWKPAVAFPAARTCPTLRSATRAPERSRSSSRGPRRSGWTGGAPPALGASRCVSRKRRSSWSSV